MSETVVLAGIVATWEQTYEENLSRYQDNDTDWSNVMLSREWACHGTRDIMVIFH